MIEPGTVLPIHRHQKTSETVVVLRGRVVEEYYSPAGVVEASFELRPMGDARAESGMTDVACALNIPAGQWHRLEALESGTVIIEFKNGPYVPIGEEDMMEM